MALDNYSNLKAAVQRLDGSNDLSDILDDCILLAETEMYNNDRVPLRCKEMLNNAVTSTGVSDAVALPTRFVEFKSINLNLSGSIEELQYTTPEGLKKTTTVGRPRYFTIRNTVMQFDRTPDSSYGMTWLYMAKTTALDSTNTTNDILTNYPNIYLFGCLWAVNLYNAEEEKANFYYQQFLRAIKGANKNWESTYGPAPTLRIEGPTP